MNDGLALLQAILDAPDDDAPRLIYADWLDEHGEGERGEFVRVSIKFARTKPCNTFKFNQGQQIAGAHHKAGTCAWCDLDRRQYAMRCEHSADWLADTPFDMGREVAGGGVLRAFDARWDRGFISFVACSAADWLAHGDAILAEHPVTSVTLTTWPDHQWQMANLPPNWTNPSELERTVYFAEIAACHRWPRVKTWTLPPEPIPVVRSRTRYTLRINGGDPIPLRSVSWIDGERFQLTAEDGWTCEGSRTRGINGQPFEIIAEPGGEVIQVDGYRYANVAPLFIP